MSDFSVENSANSDKTKKYMYLPHTTFPAGVTSPSSLTFTWIIYIKQWNKKTQFDRVISDKKKS